MHLLGETPPASNKEVRIVTPVGAKLEDAEQPPRRRLLQFLCLGLGSNLLPGASKFALAGQANNQPKQ